MWGERGGGYNTATGRFEPGLRTRTCISGSREEPGPYSEGKVRDLNRESRPEHTVRTNYAMSGRFVRDCVFACYGSVTQYVYSLSAEHFSRLPKNAISEEPSGIA